MKTLLLSMSLLACQATSHLIQVGPPPAPSSAMAALELSLATPGPIAFEQIDAADWAVELSGLLNLKDPRAAALTDHDEPIHIYFYALRHPTRGLFMVDSGMEAAIFDADKSAFTGLVRSAMKVENLKLHKSTADWIAEQKEPVKGVFLTHLHLDHTSGLPDVPKNVPIYVGPGDVQKRLAFNMFVQGTFDKQLAGHATLTEMTFSSDGVSDLFGDGSVWAVHAPGHTMGNTAYVVRTTTGPVLIAGDTSHTAWGWQHDVGPGTFCVDVDRAQASLQALRGLAARHPQMRVYLGHQALANH